MNKSSIMIGIQNALREVEEIQNGRKKPRTSTELINEIYVSDREMNEILNNKKLLRSLKKGLSDVKKGKTKVVS